MSLISRSIRTVYASTILRKLVHLVFSLLLILFFTKAYRDLVAQVWPWGPDPTLTSLTVLLFSSAMLNSVQVRVPDLRSRFLKVSSDIRKRLVEGLESSIKGKPYSEAIESFIKLLARYEERFLELVSLMERDYELQFGYIGITFALLSVTMSYVLFGYRALYGILALSVVDSLSSILTLYTRHRRRRLKHSDVSIVATFAMFMLVLYPLTLNWTLSTLLSATAILVELVSPEDNLTLPITTSLVAHVAGAPTPIL